MKHIRYTISLIAIAALVSTSVWAITPAPNKGDLRKEATPITVEYNKNFVKNLNFADKQDFADAKRGLIAPFSDPIVNTQKNFTAFDLQRWGFITDEAASPDTVNGSMWRQAQLNMNAGLFKVVDGIYQVRGLDLANMNVIPGNTGLIIVDPLTCEETSRAALKLYRETMKDDRPVVAVIYTHSHTDHYGGVRGVINEKDVISGKVKIIAPDKFLEEAVSENVYAGNALSRRVMFAYGGFLPADSKGQIDAGLGKGLSVGTVGLIAPTDVVKTTGEKRVIDGVEMVFQMAPGTEAPAEFLIYFPKYKALCAAEDATHNIHNIYTLRGAQTRDAKVWWKTLNDTLELFPDAEVVFAQHQWPTWGKENVQKFIKGQRDQIKYIHDQSLNLANKGYTMNEIGDMVKLPKSLDQEWFNRGYYGSINHNARAIYNKYLGYYSGNPAELCQLPPAQKAQKMVEYMGGEKSMIEKAKKDYAAGNYRWVAEAMNYVVFANPNNVDAKNLEADALEQLGYQTENTTWRGNFLQGANELRSGKPVVPPYYGTVSPETVRAMSTDMIFDYLGIKLNAKAVDGKTITLNFNFPDTKEKYVVTLENSVLVYTSNKQLPGADATLSISKEAIDKIVIGTDTFASGIKSGAIKVTGNAKVLDGFDGYFEKFDPVFNIVTP
ncbi:MAG: MBL fold metallo-hydrolase [Lactobacillales bacterium]|jgi:alkyl sulfatase BDS1-like metallo-beta-lactamase superfamily hydrolase|nr:MBL fold metallo-hydrolase [Lactobacillales bacterium]